MEVGNAPGARQGRGDPGRRAHPSIHGQKSLLTLYRTVLRMVWNNENGLALPRRLPEMVELRLTKGYPQ